jgi:hypothetical protein
MGLEPSGLDRKGGGTMRTTRFVAVAIGFSLVGGVGVAGADEKAPKKTPRDARLEQKLDAELQEDVRLARTGVDAEVKKGAVTLTGVVDTEIDKVRAEQIVRAEGVEKIDNRLTVLDRPTEVDASSMRQELEERRALSDPKRKDPLVGAMPAEQTGSREIRLRTMGVEDPRKADPQRGDQPSPSAPKK